MSTRQTILIILTVTTCIGLYGAESAQTKEQELNRQIAILESKVFALETENKKLKEEIEKKDKALAAYAAGKKPVVEKEPVRTNPQWAKEAREKAAKAKQIAENNKKIEELQRKRETAQRQYDDAVRRYRNCRDQKDKNGKRQFRRLMNQYKDELREIDQEISKLKFSNSRSFVTK
ncbi:MAG: hypothetical protein PHH77_06635 [Victivallaceae bacterium]|nr:hypothetical protein [Victivallaceae bacterium]